jgi:hypothetical protein
MEESQCLVKENSARLNLIDEKLLNIQADQALLRQFVEHVGNFHFKTDLSSSGIIFNNGGYSSQSTSSRSEHDGTEMNQFEGSQRNNSQRPLCGSMYSNSVFYYRLYRNHDSIYSLWNEWHGLAEFHHSRNGLLSRWF